MSASPAPSDPPDSSDSPDSPSGAAQRLSAETVAALTGAEPERPPVRLLHLGLGAFHRSHQLWHTASADSEAKWGYASFTGRSADAARILTAQDGLYTVIERSSEGDRAETIAHLVEAHDGSDLARFAAWLADPAVAVVTLTITESGYCLDGTGSLDMSDERVIADLDQLRARVSGVPPRLQTALARLVFGLDERRRAKAGAVAVLPCDNMPANGRLVRRAVRALAAAYSDDLDVWIAREVSFASSVVDRITPATTERDIEDFAAETGIRDEGLVVTEPFSEWVIAGDFPAGRPPWELSGARIVDDVAPYERRKLWMLNGAHTVLSTTARERGHHTVAQAMGDKVVRGWLEEYWDAVEPWLPEPELDLAGYRRALVERFSNARIAHHLQQIASETTTKLRYRIVPALVAEREAGRMPDGLVRPIAAWVRGLHAGARDTDAYAERIDEIVSGGSGDTYATTAALVALLDPDLAADEDLVTRVKS